jgi:NADH-quinone oxidoreductase subunit I
MIIDTQTRTTPTHTFGSLFRDVLGLMKGMGVTFRYIKSPKRIVTREYPENRETLTFPERFRGQVVMPHDAEGEHNCTACTLCEKACPNGSISILTTKNLASKRVLGQFVYRLSSCTLCNLCIEACPFDAIKMGHGFEMASYNREELDLVLNQKEGR